MTKFKRFIGSLTTIALLAALMLSLNACEQISPVSPKQDLQTNNGFKILKFGDGSHSLAKMINKKKLVTKANGGVLNLLHGSNSSGNAGLLYGVDEDSPYNLYAIDPFDIGNPALVGQLAFRTRAIAVAPEAQSEWQETTEQGSAVINVLLVVADAGNPSAQDVARKSLFESWGFTVNLISDGASQSDFDNAAAGSSVAYISEEISSGTLNTKLKHATIGVVNEERYLVDDFGIASGSGMSSDRDLQIVDVTHYILHRCSTQDTSPFSAMNNQHRKSTTVPTTRLLVYKFSVTLAVVNLPLQYLT